MYKVFLFTNSYRELVNTGAKTSFNVLVNDLEAGTESTLSKLDLFLILVVIELHLSGSPVAPRLVEYLQV